MADEQHDALAAVVKRRGYTLSYHEMLAAADPGLLAAYDEFYRRLTLEPRALAPVERELVWAGLLVAAREAHGAIHMRRAEAAGVPAAAIADAVALAGAAETLPTLRFASGHWSRWVAEEAVTARYRALVAAARGSLEPRLAALILVACHAARRCPEGLSLHLREAFDAGATPAQVAEALSYLLLPCGGPTLIDAADVWRDLGRKGAVPAPDGLTAWSPG